MLAKLVPGIALLVGCGASQPKAPVIELTATGDTVLAPYADIPEATWLGATIFPHKLSAAGRMGRI